MLGSPDQRTILAVTSAYYRVIYGQHILPGSGPQDLLRGVRRTWARAVPDGGDYPWRIEETALDAQHSQPVILVDVESLTAEDIAVQEECSACGRASRTSDIAHLSGRPEPTRVHRCRYCATRWPSADVYRVSLYKERHLRRGVGPVGCFACGCTPALPCSSECTTATEQPIAQPLCQTCACQHTPETWQALTAAGYATPASDTQHDLWLYGEALRGTPPAAAAAAWTDRRTLVRRRALAAHRAAKTPEAGP
ncbi:hypothetical protein ACWDSL_06630 [Streptomyces sp. NPDC000941]